MADSHRNVALTTAAVLLRPLADLMLKCGLSWREFSALAKTAFVAAATDGYGINGRPTNVSRVALLCGLSRKEVKRQREAMVEPAEAAPEKSTGATRLLAAWHQQAEWVDEAGNPRDLDSEAFATLCREQCADVPASVMLKELRRVGAVSVAADGRVSALARYFMPARSDTQWMLMAGHYLADMARAMSYNLDAGENDTLRFLGRASEPEIPIRLLPEFRAFLEVEGQQFLETVDAWLASHPSTAAEKAAGDTVRLGAGVFQILEQQNTAEQEH